MGVPCVRLLSALGSRGKGLCMNWPCSGNSGSKLEPQERDEHFWTHSLVDVEDTAESWGKQDRLVQDPGDPSLPSQ